MSVTGTKRVLRLRDLSIPFRGTCILGLAGDCWNNYEASFLEKIIPWKLVEMADEELWKVQLFKGRVCWIKSLSTYLRMREWTLDIAAVFLDGFCAFLIIGSSPYTRTNGFIMFSPSSKPLINQNLELEVDNGNLFIGDCSRWENFRFVIFFLLPCEEARGPIIVFMRKLLRRHVVLDIYFYVSRALISIWHCSCPSTWSTKKTFVPEMINVSLDDEL